MIDRGKHVAVAVFLVALATSMGAAKCESARGGPSNVDSPNGKVCNTIRYYAGGGGPGLPSHAAETAIKLDAAKPGVAQGIRDAIDAYYSGSRRDEGGMVNACERAGISMG